MATPEFVTSLREKIGHDMLWLPGVTAVTFDDDGRVLLCRRADSGRWALITGILDPGEEPALGALRELEEETGVVAEVEHMVHAGSHGPITFPNGDVCQFLNVAFRCRRVAGQARVNDDESLEVAWFSPDDLPELSERHRMLIGLAQKATGVPEFVR